VIVNFALKCGFTGPKTPRVLRAIVHDATIYFMVIFSSHFVFEVALLAARVSGSVVGDWNVINSFPTAKLAALAR
jgi:hypothetical protein